MSAFVAADLQIKADRLTRLFRLDLGNISADGSPLPDVGRSRGRVAGCSGHRPGIRAWHLIRRTRTLRQAAIKHTRSHEKDGSGAGLSIHNICPDLRNLTAILSSVQAGRLVVRRRYHTPPSHV